MRPGSKGPTSLSTSAYLALPPLMPPNFSRLFFLAFLAAHEEYRRDFEVPEFRLSKAVIAQHRYEFELLPLPGFCPSGTAIQHVGL